MDLPKPLVDLYFYCLNFSYGENSRRSPYRENDGSIEAIKIYG
ncbi:hypothetical protein [[Leptolyngbya] sp. PCC 7376]|nr:hypothetical protein [[Leptolyngbya] sp. PCC 7376]